MIRRRHHVDAEAFEKAWEGRATRNAEIADLVACAEQLCRAAVVEPSAEFQASLREQLMTAATTVLVPAPPRIRAPHRSPVHAPSYAVRRRLAGATAAMVGAAGFVGMVGASAQALPGEMLYPVKRGVENVELAFQNDDVARGEFRLTQASERLAEARRLTDDNSPQSRDQVAGALDDFTQQAKDGSGSLFRSFNQSGSEASITTVNDFSAAAAADLAVLSSRVPSDASASFQAAADTLSQLVAKASTLCASCGSADVTGLTGAISPLDGGPPASDPAAESNAAQQDTAPSTTKNPASVTEPLPGLTFPDLIGQSPTGQSPTGQSTGQSPPGSATIKNPPSLEQVTEPTTGAILGDEEQPGLVGGLVEGLLGGQQP
ncbi:DUF5667 domain-containing protein [Aeromicrobium sp.]|uniref:DUF5667 domain-containing protein n=1 Tax=Aeromicrobium sp. TaxID=1871063 RepID=UPI003D6AB9E1